jgi:hypothetical protein
MTTDCPTSQCNVPREALYNYTVAPDEQSSMRASDIVYKFDDQPMTAFQMEGSVFIDHFVFGEDYHINNLKFIGVNKAFNVSNPTDSRFMYNEQISGILGLAPPKTEEAKKRHFLYQLRDLGVIDYLTFSVYLESSVSGRSDIKFGSYDKDRIEEGHAISMI